MAEEVKQEEVKEEIVEEQSESLSEPSAEEQRAIQDGWVPKEKWIESGNDERDHRSAREFNDRGELLKRISEQNRYIQKTNQGIEALKQHQGRLYESAYKKAVDDLKKQHSIAVEEGKIDIADQLVDKISDEKAKFAAQQVITQAQAHSQPSQEPSQELIAWKTRNRWYDEDEDMRTFADAIGFKFVNQRQGQVTPDDVLAHVERKVKEKFMKPEPKKEAAPNPVGGVQNTRQKTETKGPKTKKSDLSEDELKGLKGWVDLKMGTEAEYLAELDKIR